MADEEKGKVEEKLEPTEPEKGEVTPEEKLSKLTEDEVTEIIKDREHWEESYKTLQRTDTRKTQELEALRKQPQPQSTGNTEVLEAILNSIPQPKDEYGNPTAPSPEVLKAQAALKTAKQHERQVKYAAHIKGLEEKAVEERQKMFKEAEDAGIDPHGEEMRFVELSWDANNAPAARKWLDRALKKVKPKGETAKTEEEIRAEVRAEEKAKAIEDLGLKKQDGGSPSGGGGSDETFLEEYSQGKSSDHKRAKVILEKIAKGG